MLARSNLHLDEFAHVASHDLRSPLRAIANTVEWLGEERPRDARPGQLVVLAARSKPQFTGEAVAGLGLRAINGGPALREWVDDEAALHGDLDRLASVDEARWAEESRSFLLYK